MKALWNGQVIAESDQTVEVEGTPYFPRESVKDEFLVESKDTTNCAWKGTASYYDIVVKGQVNSGAAWYYPDPKPAAEEIRGKVAFWKGVEVVES